MDFIKSKGQQLKRSVSERVFNNDRLQGLQGLIGAERSPKLPLSERLVRRYFSVSEEDTEESQSNSWLPSVFRRRQSSISSTKSTKSPRLQSISRQLSREEVEINKEKLSSLGDLMSVFYDKEEDPSSDQDSLIEELHDIGYLITPKGEMKGDKAIKEVVEDEEKCIFARIKKGASK